ncbi:MAG: HAD family hydrolase [Phycisphaerae bacterium]|jgi:D,D-heptose 1,7-bisphosphate phosphatase
MSNKAVFLDRDHTLIDDPSYLSNPQGVKLLPGVELALKSLTAGGYKTIVVTNQSGVARGLLTEEILGQIHDEMKRQLAEKGAYVDAVYYCPFHPQGTVEAYTRESDLRKPQPGMLLKAAREMDIDLAASWMIGDSGRDIEAGRRAGCRTVLLTQGSAEGEADDTRADFTAKDLVEAARIVLLQAQGAADSSEAASPAPAAAAAIAAPPPPPAKADIAPKEAETEALHLRREILRYVRQMAHDQEDEFSFLRLAAGIVQVLAVVSLIAGLWMMATPSRTASALLWLQVATVLQVMALTFFMLKRSR